MRSDIESNVCLITCLADLASLIMDCFNIPILNTKRNQTSLLYYNCFDCSDVFCYYTVLIVVMCFVTILELF